MKIKRKKLDIVFSNLVRERADYICQSCCENKRMEKVTADCAHIFSRRNLATRYHPDNALLLCRGCHMYYTEHPFDWTDWCRDQFGEEKMAKLRLLSNTTVKWSKPVREDIYQHYKKELKRLEAMRLSGSRGMIDFTPHEVMTLIEV